MTVRIQAASFDPFATLSDYQAKLGSSVRSIGAMASFVGSMRDFNEGDTVTSMTLEHYPGMTDKHLENLVAEAREQWNLDDALIVHRVGTVTPGDPIVLVATWSAHRAHAFESCRALMESLKSTAPFWKREKTTDGERWISNNTPGSTEEFDHS